MREVPEGMRVFSSRFIYKIKGAGELMRNKSRLFSQNYGNEDETRIATKAPTVQRSSQMGFLCLVPSLPGSLVFQRDIKKENIQATKHLERPVYMKAPHEKWVFLTILSSGRPIEA